MVRYSDWCDYSSQVVNGHGLSILLAEDCSFDMACDLIAAIVPSHYVSDERIAGIFEKFGKNRAAAYLREKLPDGAKTRSGDLGEILATEYINSSTEYMTPIKRLRWKDHREMAMRGDDVLGVATDDGNAPIKFLKGESKSRVSFSPSVVQEARQALNNCEGLPTPHALTFIMDRIYETGQEQLADMIALAQLVDGISDRQVEHLMFAFCGNDPRAHLENDLKAYQGSINQNAVGLRVQRHQEFI